MTRPTRICLATLCIAMLGGCSILRKSNRPKEATNIAADTDALFRAHWIEKRTAELVTQGVAAATAGTQAAAEFNERFSFTAPSKK